jgi:hypothetical protein
MAERSFDEEGNLSKEEIASVGNDDEVNKTIDGINVPAIVAEEEQQGPQEFETVNDDDEDSDSNRHDEELALSLDEIMQLREAAKYD